MTVSTVQAEAVANRNLQLALLQVSGIVDSGRILLWTLTIITVVLYMPKPDRGLAGDLVGMRPWECREVFDLFRSVAAALWPRVHPRSAECCAFAARELSLPAVASRCDLCRSSMFISRRSQMPCSRSFRKPEKREVEEEFSHVRACLYSRAVPDAG